MRAAQEFQQQAKTHNITSWRIYPCSLCDYKCGYLFRGDWNYVFYDSGCYCTDGGDLQDCTWQEVADHYNGQKHPTVIAEYDAFWHFEPQAEPQ